MGSQVFGSKLKQARINAGFTQKEIYEQLNIPQSTFSSWEVGKSEPDAETLIKLCSTYGIDSFAYFKDDPASPPNEKPLSDKGQCIGRAYDKATPPVQKTVDVALEPYMDEHKPYLYVEPAEEEDELIEIYDLDLPSSAGLGVYVDGSAGEMVPYPASKVPHGTDCAIHIEGDSMEPDISDGAVVFVKYQPVLDPGQIGIFIYDNDAMAYCKRFRRDHKNRPYLESSNAAYPPIYMDESEFDEWRVFGRVLGVYTEPAPDTATVLKAARDGGGFDPVEMPKDQIAKLKALRDRSDKDRPTLP